MDSKNFMQKKNKRKITLLYKNILKEMKRHDVDGLRDKIRNLLWDFLIKC